MIPRLFTYDGWYAVQTALDTIELFHYDVMGDNGIEHHAHCCTVKWVNGNCQVKWNDSGFIDRKEFPWKMLRSIFNGAA